MKDNRGLTLVELLITVTILALVVAGAATFMLAGSKSFAKGSADSNVQGEAELAVNQIEDLIIDVNGGVNFTDDTAASTLTMYHVEADASTGVAVNKKRTVKWDKSDNNIYSSEWFVEKDGSGAYVETTKVYDAQLLAENVTDFNVDLSDKYTETAKDGTDIEIVRSVVIRVDCLDGTGKATYATTPTITLRNRLMISSSPDEIFENTPAPDDSLLLYISSTGMEAALPIRDRVTTVERGKVYNIFAMVSVGTNVNSLCKFTVEGEASGHLSTITPEGVHIALDVKDSEPNNYLKITATYKTNSAKTVSRWVKVIGGESKSLDDVKIHTQSWTRTPYFKQHTTTTNFTDEEIADLKYTWSVTADEGINVDECIDNDYTRNGLDLRLRIHDDVESGTIFYITVEVYSPTTNQTVSDTVTFYYSEAGSDPRLERGKASDGKGGHGDVQNWWDVKGYWPKNYRYEYYFCNERGQEIDVPDEIFNCVVITPSYNRYTLAFTENLPPEVGYYIMVEVWYESWETSEWVWDPETGTTKEIVTPGEWFKEYECLHYIPPVSLWGGKINVAKNRKENGELGVLSSGFDFNYETEGYFELSWANNEPPVYQYDIVELNGTIPSDITVTPEIVQTECDDDNLIFARLEFKVDIPGSDDSRYSRYKEIDLNSMVIEISMKDHPSIKTKLYVTFTE